MLVCWLPEGRAQGPHRIAQLGSQGVGFHVVNANKREAVGSRKLERGVAAGLQTRSKAGADCAGHYAQVLKFMAGSPGSARGIRRPSASFHLLPGG